MQFKNPQIYELVWKEKKRKEDYFNLDLIRIKFFYVSLLSDGVNDSVGEAICF